MLTRCPSCTTIFRVSTDQLKVRQGKVRCGSCQGVFNALDSLIEEIAPASEPIAVLPAPTCEPEPDVLTGAVAHDAASDAPLDDVLDIGEPVSTAPTVDSLAVALSSEAGPPSPDSAPMSPAHVASVALSEAPSLIDNSEAAPALHDDDLPPEARFGWFWALGIVLAIVTMLAQALMIFRVEIATSVPETRPWFVAACELLDCRVDLARKANLLAIESSDLNPDPAFPGQSGRLRLHASLHNRASHAQEWPALEVTLTDTNDRPLIRRALTAKEYLLAAKPAPGNLEQGIGGQQEISIELALDSGDVLASGYRLYLFYP